MYLLLRTVRTFSQTVSMRPLISPSFSLVLDKLCCWFVNLSCISCHFLCFFLFSNIEFCISVYKETGKVLFLVEGPPPFGSSWVKHYCMYRKAAKKFTMIPFEHRSGGKLVSVCFLYFVLSVRWSSRASI